MVLSMLFGRLMTYVSKLLWSVKLKLTIIKSNAKDDNENGNIDAKCWSGVHCVLEYNDDDEDRGVTAILGSPITVTTSQRAGIGLNGSPAHCTAIVVKSGTSTGTSTSNSTGTQTLQCGLNGSPAHWTAIVVELILPTVVLVLELVLVLLKTLQCG